MARSQLHRRCDLCGEDRPQSYAVRLEADEDGAETHIVYCTACRTRTASQRGYSEAFMFDHAGFLDWDDHPLGGLYDEPICTICDKKLDVVNGRRVCLAHPSAGLYFHR